MNIIKKVSLPVLTFVFAWIGAQSTFNTDWLWYENLNKSELNPPSFIFGIVWPILYTFMAIVSFLQAKILFRPFIMQLILNGAWSWIFFVFQLPELALLNILILIGINTEILRLLKQERAYISLIIYTPYILWLCFACYLNASISILN